MSSTAQRESIGESKQRVMAYKDRFHAKLNAKQQRFVQEYLVDLNATQAAIRAGYSVRNAGVTGNTLKRNKLILAAIEAAQEKLGESLNITQAMVLQRYWMIATANPNELVIHRRVCCRHCHGLRFAYQWKDRDEFERAYANSEQNETEPPSDEGGFGFNRTLRPNKACPECHGEGYPDIQGQDTRDASPSALALYAGVKQTKDGFEVKTHDQLAALNMVARHLGMFNDKLTLKGDAENPLALLLQQVAGNTLKPADDQ